MTSANIGYIGQTKKDVLATCTIFAQTEMISALTEKERRTIELARFMNVDKAIEILSKRAKAEGELGLNTRSTKFAIAFIERQPEADVVEVVRCKDCLYANDRGTICRYSIGKAVEPEHFCSYGERRKDDEA